MTGATDPRATLSARMTPLGFGGAEIGNLFESMPDGQAEAAVASALEGGIRYFDTAPFYGFGLSEKRLGRALARRPGSAGVVLSTKVGRRLVAAPEADLAAVRSKFVSPEPFQAVFDYSYDAVMRSWEESQRRLCRERLDILLVHDLGRRTHGAAHAEHFRIFMDDGYRAVRQLRDCGQIAAIGLGVNEVEVCVEALQHADFDMILLAGRYTLLEQRPLDLLFPVCAARRVGVVVGGPYNSGILATGGRDAPRYDYGAAPDHIVAKVSGIERVCARHGVALAAAALQFPLGNPQVVSVLPGLADESQVRAALGAMETPVPDGLWEELKALRLLREDAPTGGGRR